MTTQTRPLYEIAEEIRKDWKATAKNGIYYGAVPYIDAMSTLNSIDNNFMFDSGKEIVLKFLGNAGTWRGETAKRVKAELKKIAGI